MASLGPFIPSSNIPSNPSKFVLGSIKEGKKELTIKDYVKYTSSSGLGRIISMIALGLKGKGLVDENSLHNLAVAKLSSLNNEELGKINELADKVINNKVPLNAKNKEKMEKEKACAHAAKKLIEDAVDSKDEKGMSLFSFLNSLGYEKIQSSIGLQDIFKEYLAYIEQPAVSIGSLPHKNHIAIEEAIKYTQKIADSSEDSETVYSEDLQSKNPKDLRTQGPKQDRLYFSDDESDSETVITEDADIAPSESIDEPRNLPSSRRANDSSEESTIDELETAIEFTLKDYKEREEEMSSEEKSALPTLSDYAKEQIVKGFVEYLAVQMTEDKLSLGELLYLESAIESHGTEDQYEEMAEITYKLENTSQEKTKSFYRSLDVWQSLKNLGDYSKISSSPLESMLKKYEAQTPKPLSFETSEKNRERYIDNFLTYVVEELYNQKLSVDEIDHLIGAVNQNNKNQSVIEMLTRRAAAEARRVAADTKKEEMSLEALAQMSLSQIANLPDFKGAFSDFINEFGNMLYKGNTEYFEQFESLDNLNNPLSLQAYFINNGDKYTLDIIQVQGSTAQLFKNLFWEYLAFNAKNI